MIISIQDILPLKTSSVPSSVGAKAAGATEAPTELISLKSGSY